MRIDEVARRIRGKVIEMSHRSGAAHLGSSLSCIDILVACYWAALKISPSHPLDPLRDRFILSKGHAASALYATLAFKGFFPLDLLDSFGQVGSKLTEHPGPGCVPGVEVGTGSLGHGLSLGIGIALGAQIQKLNFRIFVLLSDGECNEGSVWEAAMFAPAHKLEHLTAIIDFNRWQATGRSEEIMALQPLREKWAAFGWKVYEVDGHDLKLLSELLAQEPDGSGKPRVIIAKTVKGKGISFMEDNNNWHYRVPSEEEMQAAFKELDLA